MRCLVCGSDAEQILARIGSTGVVCAVCGIYDIENAVIAAGQLPGLEPEQRRSVLDRAKRSAPTGARPLIRPYLLA
jgi:hypothetical protein